jgi:alpha-ketoglutarate-dependent taurine dioxygenase
MKITPHGPSKGRIAQPEAGEGLEDIKREWLLEQLAEGGYVLLRGFGCTREGFGDLVRRISSRVTLDPARSFGGDDTVQKVDAGTDAIGMHIEHGNNPFTPHLTWFFSERAAKRGSQTTVADGYDVWEALSPETRQAFTDQEIVYIRQRVEEPKWKLLVFHSLGRTKPMDDITVDDLRGLIPASVKMDVRLNEDDNSVYYAYTTPAAHPTVFGERWAFANSILGPSYNYEKPRITFADGTDIPESVLKEIEEVAERLTVNIDWEDGDVLVADNTRMMHGRREIVDTDRVLMNALSFVAV